MRTILLSLRSLPWSCCRRGAATETEQRDMASMQLAKEFGKRFDRTAGDVRSMQTQPRKLEAQGRHARALKLY